MNQKCDTCGKEVPEVMRVVIKKDYDRTKSNAVYNCPDCFTKKKKESETQQK